MKTDIVKQRHLFSQQKKSCIKPVNMIKVFLVLHHISYIEYGVEDHVGDEKKNAFVMS